MRTYRYYESGGERGETQVEVLVEEDELREYDFDFWKSYNLNKLSPEEMTWDNFIAEWLRDYDAELVEDTEDYENRSYDADSERYERADDSA